MIKSRDSITRLDRMPNLARPRVCAPLLLLAACAQPVPAPVAQATRPYVPPAASTATARLVMRNAIDKADLSYEVAVFDDADRCTGRQRIGSGTQASDPETTTIAAARWQTIETIAHQPNHMMCRDRWTFAPVAGRSYLVRTTSKPDGCTTVIYDMTNPEALRIEPTLRRRQTTRENVCLPLAQAQQIKLNAAQRPADSSDLPIPAETPHAPSIPSTEPAAKSPQAKAGAGTAVDDLQGLIAH